MEVTMPVVLNEKLENYMRIINLYCTSPAQSFTIKGKYLNQLINLTGLYGEDPQLIVNSLHESRLNKIQIELHVYFSCGVQYCFAGIVENYEVYSVAESDNKIIFNVLLVNMVVADRENPTLYK